jgi:YbbR domain-containing protein
MKKRLPQFTEQLANNWLYKVVALIVALSIWITTLENKKDVMRSREIRVEFSVAKNLVLTSSIPRAATVKVMGPKILVKRYLKSPFLVNVERLALTAGTHRIELNASDLGLPPGLKIYSVDPKFFDIEIQGVK